MTSLILFTVEAPLTTLLYEGLLSRRKSQVFSLFIELTCLVCTNASDNRSLCDPSKTMSIGLPGKHEFALRTLVVSALNASKRERKTEEANNLSMASSYVQSAGNWKRQCSHPKPVFIEYFHWPDLKHWVPINFSICGTTFVNCAKIQFRH